MFDRFTDDARRVVVTAQERCRLLGHDQIGTEHLLLALLQEGTDPTGAALRAAGANLRDATDLIEQSRQPGRAAPYGHIPFTAGAKRVLAQSLRESQRLGHQHIARPHLLLGLLAGQDSVAVRTLLGLGVDLEALAGRIGELAAASERPAPGRGGDRPGRRAAAAAEPGSGWPTSRQSAQPREKLVAAFRRYARHDDGCDPASEQGCSCGLEALLRSLPAD